jgi:hypothetical protein
VQYPHQLPQPLGHLFTGVTGGLGGWGIDSEIKWYYSTGVAHRPRIVILQFSANDPSDTGADAVTRIEHERFTFYPYPFRKPTWQAMISGSFLLQNSHLYSILRVVYSGTMSASGGTQVLPTQVGSVQSHYTSLLRLFARTLNEAGTDLLFVSVTHEHANGSYHYDLEDFPEIYAEVKRLEEAELLRFVDLPLTEMRRSPRSPEPNHQWSSVHHNLVGVALAEAVVAASGKPGAARADASQ